MKKNSRIIAILLALELMVPMAACGSGDDTKESSVSSAESSATEDIASATASESSEKSTTDAPSSAPESSPEEEATTTSEALKEIFSALLESKNYKEFKASYSNTTFEEKLVGDSIVINISGTDGVEGSCTFPVEDGYIICQSSPDDSLSSMIFNFYIMGSIADYYEIEPALFVGYTNYLLQSDSKDYVADVKEDGSGTIKLKIDKKPDISVLDEDYITEDVASMFYNDKMTQFTLNYGKMLLNALINRDNNSVKMAIGEYGDKNTEISYKSILTILNLVKPTGYEDFLKDFTELKELKTDKYSVSFDSDAFAKEEGMELNSNYKFIIIKIGG